jgi:hypothetical protein
MNNYLFNLNILHKELFFAVVTTLTTSLFLINYDDDDLYNKIYELNYDGNNQDNTDFIKEHYSSYIENIMNYISII